jgi:hypothetical protein
MKSEKLKDMPKASLREKLKVEMNLLIGRKLCSLKNSDW